MNSKEDVLVAVSKPWASNDKKLSAAVQRIATCVESIEGVTIASYNSDSNFAQNDIFAVGEKEYDGLLFFKPAGKPLARYKGKVKQADLLKFLKKKSKAVSKGWASVKAVLKKIKDDAKKRKEEEAAAAKAEEEKLESAEKQELVAEVAGCCMVQIT